MSWGDVVHSAGRLVHGLEPRLYDHFEGGGPQSYSWPSAGGNAQRYRKIEKISCNVRFLYVIPKDTQKYPYVLWISYGIHSHPPPPYNRTPTQVQDEIMELIRRSDSMTLTVGTTLFITLIPFGIC